VGALLLAFASGAAADHFLTPWKLGEAGLSFAVRGFTLVAINQVLVLPAMVLSHGLHSAVVSIVALIICFSLWGLVVALIWRRVSRRRKVLVPNQRLERPVTPKSDAP
jgi:hypothetical protein